MIWSNFSIKILGINFDNFISENSNWDKIKDNITKKIHIWNRVRLSLRGKKLITKSNSTFGTLVHGTDLYNSKIHQKTN